MLNDEEAEEQRGWCSFMIVYDLPNVPLKMCFNLKSVPKTYFYCRTDGIEQEMSSTE